MAKFVLQPCHLRDFKFAPIKGTEPTTFDWEELRQKLAPSNERSALHNLRALRIGSYVGLLKDLKTPNGRPGNFVLFNLDRSARLDWLLKQQPTFEERLLEVYRVDEVLWDSKVEEFKGTPDLPSWERQGATR